MRQTLGSPIRERLARVYRAVRSRWLALRGLPLIRFVRASQLRRLSPLAGGRQRGGPVIRYYWERFLDRHRTDVRGRCLEIGTDRTIRHYGGPAVSGVDVMDVAPREAVTLVADLSRADSVAAGSYDCIVVPFTMHLIYDVEAALHHAVRILTPGGVLLVNFPCVDYYFPRGLDMGTGRPLFVHWWFTPIQVQNLLRRVGLESGDFTLVADGNLFARVAYQMNMPIEELTPVERDHQDEGHPLLISARIVKPATWAGRRPEYRDAWLPDVTPADWDPVTGHYPRT